MAQDFAKRKPGTDNRKAAARKIQAQRHGGDKPASRGKGAQLYLSGVLTGLFLSLLLYLVTLKPPVEPGQDIASAPQPEAAPETPKPDFTFYNVLQQSTIVEEPEPVEPAADLPKPRAESGVQQPYFLQAGSFRQREDAERRRAEILLLGLEPRIEETTGDNGKWFRVSLGPFNSPQSISQARGLLAKQKIESVLLRRSGP